MTFFNKKDISSFTDESLMKEIERGNATAFNLLYDRYSGKLYGYLFRLLYNDAAKAEDFLQELFLKVLNAASTFNTNQNVSTWLYTIATNMCRNEWRNNANRQRLMKQFEPWEHHSEKSINDLLDERKWNKVLYEIIQKLEDVEREIIQLRFQQELSIREIATITKLPEGTVKSKLFYLLKKMAKHLKTNPITTL